MNLSPIPSNYRKNFKLDEDFFSIEEERNSSINSSDKKDKRDKRTHSLLDFKIDISKDSEKENDLQSEEKKETFKSIHNLILKSNKETNELLPPLNLKKRLSRAVDNNIILELEKNEKESLEKSQISKDSNSDKDHSSSSSSSEKNSSSHSSSFKSSYSYSSSSSSISIENQENMEINNMIT